MGELQTSEGRQGAQLHCKEPMIKIADPRQKQKKKIVTRFSKKTVVYRHKENVPNSRFARIIHAILNIFPTKTIMWNSNRCIPY